MTTDPKTLVDALLARVLSYTEDPKLPNDALALARWSLADDGTEVSREVTYGDLRALVAEVERLRAEMTVMADTTAQQVRALEQERHDLTAEVERLRADNARLTKCAIIVNRLAQAWHYGDWKAETHNERRMEELMREFGAWPYRGATERHDAAQRGGVRDA